MQFHLREIKKFLEFLKWHVTPMLKCEYQRVKNKFKKAFESNFMSVTIRLTFSDLHDEDVITLTTSKFDRLVEVYKEKKGMTIKMSKTQLANNMKIGGILPALAGLIPFLTGTIFTCIRSWAFIRTSEHGSTKTNWKWVLSEEGKSCVSDRHWWSRFVSWTNKR